MTADLRSYLKDIDDLLLRVPAAVPLEYLSALINQANQPVLFENIQGYPGWRVCDLLFRDRRCQARALGTTPDKVLAEVARRLAMSPREVMRVSSGPVKERRWADATLSLGAIPGFQHGAEDMGRVVIAMTICQDPRTGRDNLAWTRMTPLSEIAGRPSSLAAHRTCVRS